MGTAYGRSAARASMSSLLGVEDKLSDLRSGRSPISASRPSRIRPDGKITFPLVGDVQAAGRTPRQLTEDLTKILGRFIKEPVVTVVCRRDQQLQSLRSR